jgi:hypothetical protein
VSRQSQRFTPTRWSKYLVPALLIVLLLVLLAILLLIVLSMLGLTPGA